MAVKKSVLITGCSEGGLGDALARAFHQKGYRVLASARNPQKMAHLLPLGIETVVLDVESSESIKAAVEKVSQLTGGTLDMLVNNSGLGYSMPIADVDVDRARQLFDVNVFSIITMTQAFLPLLRQAAPGSMLVNNTSIASCLATPLEGIYGASKAAAASINDALRIELKPFDIKVIELKTGAIHTNFFQNHTKNSAGAPKLPANSIYEAGRDIIEKKLTGEHNMEGASDPNVWAAQVVSDLSRPNPPALVWRGAYSFSVWFLRKLLPHTSVDIIAAGRAGINEFAQRLRDQKKQS